MSKRTLTADDFPYDPWAVPEMLDGLDKLRAVWDRDYAKVLFEMYWIVEANEQKPEFQQRERDRQELKKKQELEQLRAICASALAGTFGDEAKRIANEYLVTSQFGHAQQREDKPSLEACAKAVKNIPAEQRERQTPERRKGRSE